jgi:hypothetical protein
MLGPLLTLRRRLEQEYWEDEQTQRQLLQTDTVGLVRRRSRVLATIADGRPRNPRCAYCCACRLDRR